MTDKLHTGEKVEDSGIYRVKGTEYEIILSKGDKVPPYDKRAVDVVLAHKVKHDRYPKIKTLFTPRLVV